MSSRGFPSLTALLALLAVAGYQNRDKIAEMMRGATQGSPSASPGSAGDISSSLGGILGGLGGLFGGAAQGNVVQDALSELVERFRQNGQGEAADSWVGTGTNMGIDGPNLEQAIGSDILATLSERTGISRGELLDRLSRTLPQAVDAYTPEGRL